MKFTKLAIIAALMASTAMSGCTRAMANKQTMITHNCGKTYDLIPAGEVVPNPVGMCSWVITIPDYPMPGDANFRTAFAGNVVVSAKMDYTYIIADARKFLGNARYLGKPNSDANDDGNSKAYELAENVVIDKLIRDVTNDILRAQNIVTYDASEVETTLLTKVNAVLAEKGIQLQTLALVIQAGPHTQDAIDTTTAMQVYQASGLADLGRQVMVARAGAPHIVTNVTSQVPAQED